MSTTDYRNQEALNKALHVYLKAMYSFVSECLGEELLRKALRLPADSNIEEKIEVKDIAHLIRPQTRWEGYFKEKFKVIDRYGKIRYYNAQSVASLIVEGRNQVSHQLLQDLDPEFTRAQLFLIAEILGKIKSPDAQSEVEDIRDKLFNDTTEQLVAMAVEDEKTTYEKSIAEVEKRLAAAEENNKKLSKQVVDKTTKLDKKKEELEKLSEQFVGVKLSKTKSEKQLKSTSKQLEKLQTVHSACEERLTTAEAEKDDYKERFETKRKELEAAETEWQACEDSLVAIRKLFMTVSIGNQEVQEIFQRVYPPIKSDSAVRILDRRGVDKKKYLLELLEQKQSTIIYVQSEDKIEQLRKRVVPEKADVIGEHNERTSEAEEKEILEKLENGELIAVVSNTTFSTLASSHCIGHFVFCHLVPGLDEFYKRCESAFTSEKNTYLHLIYNKKQDIEGLDQWLVQKYPDREVLVKMYRELERLAGVNGDFIKPEKVYSELNIGKPSIETGLAVFEELQLLKQNGESIKLLPDVRTDLDQSEIYRRGEELKKETANFQAFQLEHSIEQIWEEILAKLDVDSEQILEASSVYEVRAFPDAIEDSGAQSEPSTDVVENDSKSDTEVSEAQSDRPTDAVENDNTVDGEDVEVKQPPKSTRKSSEPQKSAADKFREAKSLDERKEIGRQVAELRINSSGSKPSWRSIRTKLGLKNDEFHKVIRLEDHFHESVVERIESFEDGWQYDGKLEVLLGFEPVGELLKRIEACKPTSKVEAKKEGEPQVEESKDKVP